MTLVLYAQKNDIRKLADKHYKNCEFYVAGQEYGRILRHDSTDIAALYKLADCHRKSYQYKMAEPVYRKLIANYSVQYPLSRYWYACMLKHKGDYKNAADQFRIILSEYNGPTDAALQLAGCLEALSIGEDAWVASEIKSPHGNSQRTFTLYPFQDTMLIADVGYHSYCGDIDLAGSELYLYELLSDKSIRIMDDSFFQAANKEQYRITEGTKFYFTRGSLNYIKDSLVQEAKIFVTVYQDGKWRKAKPLNENINLPKSWNGHPSVSEDGKILYFASNRVGGKGQEDIWYSTSEGNDDWSIPKNAGDSVNTSQRELFPSFKQSSNELNFASSGRPGYGGLDIYQYQLVGSTVVKHFPSPINSNGHDACFIEYKGIQLVSSIRNNARSIFYLKPIKP